MLPDDELKVRALRVEREVKGGALAGEVLVQLCASQRE